MIFYGLILFISFLVAWIFKGQEDPALSTIPGPQPLPFLGNAMMFFGPSEYVWLKTLKDLRNEFGNVVKFYSGRTAKIFLFGAEGAEKVLSSSSHIRKGYHYRFTCPWLGQSLLTSTGSRWHKHRKLLTPTFHFKILEDFLHTINDHSKTLVDGLSDTVGQTVDLYDIMRLCTLDIICETAMGVTVTSQNNKNSEYTKAIHETTVLLFQIRLLLGKNSKRMLNA